MAIFIMPRQFCQTIILLLLSVLSACTAQQMQGPILIGGVLVAPLVMPFTLPGEDCELPAEGELQVRDQDHLVALRCGHWKMTTVGWIDDGHLLYRIGNSYYIYVASAEQSVLAEDLFADFARHTVVPCTDGKGHVDAIRRRWDDYWYVRYQLNAPQRDPYVREITENDDPLAACPPHSPEVAVSLNSCARAELRRETGSDGSEYAYLVSAWQCGEK
jgi:hypothetical protein